MKNRMSVFLLISVLTFGILACGSKNNDQQSAETIESNRPTVSNVNDVTVTSIDTNRPEDTNKSNLEKCQAFVQIKDLSIKAAVEVVPSASTLKKLRDLAPSIPEEIREDYEFILHVNEKLSQIQSDDPDAQTKSLEINTDPKLGEAQRAISNYAYEECGLNLV